MKKRENLTKVSEYNDKYKECYSDYTRTRLLMVGKVPQLFYEVIANNFAYVLNQLMIIATEFKKYLPPRSDPSFKKFGILMTKFAILRGDVFLEICKLPRISDYRAEVFQNYYIAVGNVNLDIECLSIFTKEDPEIPEFHNQVYQAISFVQTYWDEPEGNSAKKELINLERIFWMLAEKSSQDFIKLIGYKNSLSLVDKHTMHSVYSTCKVAYNNICQSFAVLIKENRLLDWNKLDYIHANVSRCRIEIKLYPNVKENIKENIKNKKQQDKDLLIESYNISFNAINTYIFPSIALLKTIDFNNLNQSCEFVEFNKIVYEIFELLKTEMHSLYQINNTFNEKLPENFYKNFKILQGGIEEFVKHYDKFLKEILVESKRVVNIINVMNGEMEKIQVIVDDLDAQEKKKQNAVKKKQRYQINCANKLKKELLIAEQQKEGAEVRKREEIEKVEAIERQKQEMELLKNQSNDNEDPINKTVDEPVTSTSVIEPDFVREFRVINTLRKKEDFQEAMAQCNFLKNKGIAEKDNKLLLMAMEHLVGIQEDIIISELTLIQIMLEARLSNRGSFDSDELGKLQQLVIDVFSKQSYLKNLEMEYNALANNEKIDEKLKIGIDLGNDSIKKKMKCIMEKGEKVKATYEEVLNQKHKQKNRKKNQKADSKIVKNEQPNYYVPENEVLDLIKPFIKNIATIFNENLILEVNSEACVRYLLSPIRSAFNELSTVDNQVEFWLTGSAATASVLRSWGDLCFFFNDLDFIVKGNLQDPLIKDGFCKSSHVDGLYTKNTRVPLSIDLSLLGEEQSIEESLSQRDLSICTIAINQNRVIKAGSPRALKDLKDKYLYVENPVDALNKSPEIAIRVLKFLPRGFRGDPDLLNAIYNWEPKKDTNFVHIKLVTKKLFEHYNYYEKKEFAGYLIAYGLLEKMFEIEYRGSLNQVVSVLEFRINNPNYTVGAGKHRNGYFNESREIVNNIETNLDNNKGFS